VFIASLKTSQVLSGWKSLTSDKWILDVINGYKIEFEQLPKQSWKPKELVFSVEETLYVEQEVEIVLVKGIIRPVADEAGQNVSNIFLRPKKDGSHRVILNLKQLNTDIKHYHFKMETLTTALSCIY
jgi:hypothetical protein